MVGEAVLRKIVGADLLRTVARAHHLLAFFRQRVLLLLHFDFVQTRAQNAHAFFAVLDLRLLILTADHRVRRNVRDPDRRISRIHRLPARPRRTKCIDAQILGFDLDVDFFRFRQHRHRDRRRMHSTLLLGRRHALHAMHATLILQARISRTTFFSSFGSFGNSSTLSSSSTVTMRASSFASSSSAYARISGSVSSTSTALLS